jgi:hypothetical protein
MKEAWRRVVGAVVAVVGLVAIASLSSAIVAVLSMALVWVGRLAAMVLPAWLVSTARHAILGFALVFVASLASIVVLSHGEDELSWAFCGVGIRKSEKAPAPSPFDSGHDRPGGV